MITEQALISIISQPIYNFIRMHGHGHGHGHGGGGERRMDLQSLIPSYASQYYNSYGSNPYAADPYSAYGAGYGSSYNNFGQFLWRKKRSLLDAIYSTFQKEK